MSLTAIFIWVAVLIVLFAIAWRKGYVALVRNYVQQTRDELRKCTWPTWDELKGSTVVVSISTALLGLFIFLVDMIFVRLFMWVARL